MAKAVTERDLLRDQVVKLQAANTRGVEERRALCAALEVMTSSIPLEGTPVREFLPCLLPRVP